MEIKRKDYPAFIYLWYHHDEFRDSQKLKQELNAIQVVPDEQRDIVVDFAANNDILSAEIAALVRILTWLRGTTRFLRIIANPRVAATLQAMNLTKLSNIVIYDDQRKFVESVKDACKAA